MKHKKNNAVEKVENIINDKEHSVYDGDKEKTNEEQMKAHEKAEKEKQKAFSKRYKQRVREEKKRRKKESGASGKKGLIVATIVLSATTVAFATALACSAIIPSQTEKALENTYKRAFYDTLLQVDNIDLNLSKAISTTDDKAMQKYLLDLAVNSELAENDIGELPLHDESKFYSAKLINQIGDFAKYLNKKLIDGEGLAKEDYQTLETLSEHNQALKEALNGVSKKMDSKFSFNKLAFGKEDKIVIDNLNNLQNLSAEYPELIYDGPFSDGRESTQIKGLSGQEVSVGYAEQKFKAIFSDYGLEEIESVGLSEDRIPCYNIQGSKDEEVLYAQISKTQGKLIMFAYSGSCKAVNIEKDQATEIGKEFLKEQEIENVSAVWINLANNVYTINYAHEKDGVIVYADLVKIRVCAETGMVIGMEGVGYYTNHTDRNIEKAKLTEKEAVEKVSKNIDVESVRLALVKIGENTEKLAYEFMGTSKGDTYYVYIDAINGRQIEMFKVMQGAEGELLM